MTITPPNVARDGFTTMERGVDSGRDPSLIGRNQMAFGVNTAVRGGFVSHRPGYTKLTLEFGETTESRFREGRFQRAKYFKPTGGATERVVLSLSGRMFAFIPDQQGGDENTVQEITPAQPHSTTTTAAFTVPAVGSTVSVSLTTVLWFQIGLRLLVDGNEYEVVSVENHLTATLENVDDTPGNTVDSGSDVLCAPHTDVNNSYRWKAWMEQAEDFMVIQDGQSSPIIYNGSEARRASVDEVPVGTVMAYGLGRLWVARGREFVASDIVGGPSGTALYNQRDAILHFTENDYINEGGAFLAPGEITGMAFPSNLDTSLGEGELTVFHQGGAVTVRVPASRDDWKNLSIPLQRVSLKPFGATGQESIVEVNGDFWFRSKDGIRSFVMAQRQFGEWGNTPMSREMNTVLSADDEKLLINTSGVLFDNRLLMTCVGQRDFDRGFYFRGLISLDFDPVSGMFDRVPPAYDGVWTGLNIFQLVVGEFRGVIRCFAFVLNSDRELEVWEITKNDIVDRPASGRETRIEWSVTTGRLGFGDNTGLKKLIGARIFRDRLQGSVDGCIEYRPDQYAVWQEWDCWTDFVSKQWCAGNDCTPLIPLPQHRTRTNFPRLAQPTDELSDRKPMNQGFDFQFRVTVTGSARIRRMEFDTEVLQERQTGGCPTSDTIEVVVTDSSCGDNFLTYDSTDSTQYLLTEDRDYLTIEDGVRFIV
jgi:hypothetical protein